MPRRGGIVDGACAEDLTIGVMEISGRGETSDWMCDITHRQLNALLSKFENLKVISKDMIDWKK